MSLHRTTFHRVLHRSSLFLGGEREPALMTAIVAGGLAVAGTNTVSFVIGAALWLQLHSLCCVGWPRPTRR